MFEHGFNLKTSAFIYPDEVFINYKDDNYCRENVLEINHFETGYKICQIRSV
jgi:hypothetical protein|tara:strand:- start:363 stop:518 length:156 start_codon:yes stop_codon:yes gene_type:complete